MLPKGATLDDPGVIDQNVRGGDAVLVLQCLSSSFDGGEFTEVNLLLNDCGAEGTDFLADMVQRSGVDIPQDHPCRALLGCAQGVQTAHAHARTGNQNGGTG